MGAGDYRGDCPNHSASDAGKDVAAFQVGMGSNPVSSNSALARPNTLTLSTSFVNSCAAQLPACTNVLTPNTPTTVHSTIVTSPTVVSGSTLGTPITPSNVNSGATQSNVPCWDRAPDPKEWQNLTPAERNIVYVRIGPKEFWLSKAKLKLIQMNLGNTAIANNIAQFIASNYHLNGPDNPFVVHKCDGTTMEDIMKDMQSSRSNNSSDNGMIRSSSEPVRSSIISNLVQSSFSNSSPLQSSSLHSSLPSMFQCTSSVTDDAPPIRTRVIYKVQSTPTLNYDTQNCSNNGAPDQDKTVTSDADHEEETDYSEDRANSSSERYESSDNESGGELTKEDFENAVETILATGGMFISEHGEFSGSVLYDDSLVELEPESNDEEDRPLASDSEVDEEFTLTVKESSTAEGIASNGSDDGTINDELFADHSDFDSSDDDYECFSNAEDGEDTVRVMSVKALHVSSGVVIQGKSYRGSGIEAKSCIECEAVTGNFYKYCRNCWKIRKDCLPSPPKRKKWKPRHRHKHRVEFQRTASSGNSDEDVVDGELKANEVIVSEQKSDKLSTDESETIPLDACKSIPTSEKIPKEQTDRDGANVSPDQLPTADCLSIESQALDSGIGSSQEMVVDEVTERKFLKPSRVTTRRRRPSDIIDKVLLNEQQFAYKAINEGKTVKRRISDESFNRKSKKKAVETNPVEEFLTVNSMGLSNDGDEVSTDDKIKLASDAIVDFLCSEKSSKFFDSAYGRSWLCSKEVQATYRNVLIKSAKDKQEDSNDVSLCSLCCLRPKDAAIIHGRVSHQATCYPCAKTLFERKQRCPVCRRKILSISKHIIA